MSEEKRIIVTIGPGFRPPGSYLGREINPNEIHYVFEIDKETIDKAFDDMTPRDLPEKLRRIGSHVILVPQDGRNTGLESNSVHEVHIHNVFTDPLMPPWVADGILKEAARILRQDGVIYMGNTTAPEYPILWPLGTMIKWRGLKMRILGRNDPKNHNERGRFNAAVKQHMGKSFDDFDWGYVAALTKRPDWTEERWGKPSLWQKLKNKFAKGSQNKNPVTPKGNSIKHD